MAALLKRLVKPSTILLFCALAACSPPLSVEQQIIAVIRDMEARIEASERRPFMEHVAAEFTGQQEAMTRDQLNALVLYQLHRHQKLRAQLFPIQVIALKPEEAEARFRALVTGGPGWLPESGQVYEIETRWLRQDDEWRLISAHWKPVQIENMTDF
jgi:hypothetical protein